MDTQEIAEKYGISRDLVEELLTKLRHTAGKQVQFSDEALGGMGQWSAGMVMVGRMGDSALKAKVDALCTELAELARSEAPDKTTEGTPERPAQPSKSVHSPSAAGSQNGIRYAYFAADDRLVIERDGVEKTYDATGYPITGVAQDQATGASATLRFTTKNGDVVNLDTLKQVS
ncbi:MAG: SHOCT domain-containing protein [Akkermansiaceae bacterium]|nr:SHOCT domain-containing protein [Armatimonadota bacterium]